MVVYFVLIRFLRISTNRAFFPLKLRRLSISCWMVAIQILEKLQTKDMLTKKIQLPTVIRLEIFKIHSKAAKLSSTHTSLVALTPTLNESNLRQIQQIHTNINKVKGRGMYKQMEGLAQCLVRRPNHLQQLAVLLLLSLKIKKEEWRRIESVLLPYE